MLEALIPVGNATVSCGGTLIFAPLRSAFQPHPQRTSFQADVEGDFACLTHDGQTKIWRSTSLAAHNLNFQETMTESFSPAKDCQHSDDRFNFWRSDCDYGLRDAHGLNFDEPVHLSSVPAVAANFMERPRLLTFSNLRFSQEKAQSLTVSLQAEDGFAHVSLSLNSDGGVNLHESAPGGNVSLAQTKLPSSCLQGGLCGSVALSLDLYELRIDCNGSKAAIVSSGQHKVELADFWEGNGNARVILDFERAEQHQYNESTTLGAIALTPHDFDAIKKPTYPAVLGPNVNGISLKDPGLGAAQPLAALGYVDVTKPPFSADATGATDSTAALQKAADFAMQHYLVTYLPHGRYLVTDTISAIEGEKYFLSTVGAPNCNNMPEVFNGSRKQHAHCTRTQPYVFMGASTSSSSNSSNSGRPTLVLQAERNLDGPVVLLHNPENENINMNQVFSGIDIEIQPGNPQATGIQARAAQGTSVQDVTIYAGDAAVGLAGGAGSGGSHIKVTVVGGRVGVSLGSSQPSPTCSGLTLVNQSVSAVVYDAPGRQTLSLVGIEITALSSASGPAIDAAVAVSLADSVIRRVHVPAATKVATKIATNTKVGDQCNTQSGVNCDGRNVLPEKANPVVASAAECCAVCANTSGCVYWTWNIGSNKICYPKRDCDSRPQASPAHISGGRSPLPPHPAPGPSPSPSPSPSPVSGAVAIRSGASLFLSNVYITGYDTAVAFQDGSPSVAGTGAGSGDYTHVELLAHGGPANAATGVTMPVIVGGNRSTRSLVRVATVSALPAASVTAQHRWDSAAFPSFDTLYYGAAGVCDVTSAKYGARGDLATDDTASLQAALDDADCRVVFLPKGYYAVSRTLQLRPNASLIGASRLLSNIVPHASIAPTIPPPTPASPSVAWPLLRTADGSGDNTTVACLSLLVWHHVNATFALHWRAGRGQWREAHVNRVDLDPGRGSPPAYYNIPLTLVTGSGGGRFWNFYQENWWMQGPKYRHMLVNGSTSPLHFYHANTEHSQGEANLEIAGVQSAVRIYGFKGESNYVQVWVRDSADFLLLGYGGNASPFPSNCSYPPGYADYTPSLLRVERTKKFMFANLITQLGKAHDCACGIFDTGFSGNFYPPSCWATMLDVPAGGGHGSTTAPLDWPVLYGAGF